jgi:VanZ family protein
LISLVIETTQGFIPPRDSSQRDVLCNTLGALLGAAAAAFAVKRFTR